MKNKPGRFTIEWEDRGREPKVAPNPAYPNGVAIDVSQSARDSCTAKLPYPAKRIGLYLVSCDVCRFHVAITAAGRPDDPNSVTLPCYAGMTGTPP